MSTAYRVFAKGLITVLPILLTVYLLAWIAARAENLFGDGLSALFPSVYFPGLGLAFTVLFIFAVGLIVNHYLAAQTVAWLERSLERVPVIKAIYGPIKDVMGLFGDARDQGMNRAVLVELPALGSSVIGLVTRDGFGDLRRAGAHVPDDRVAVFIPYSYAMGGFTLLVPKANVRELGLPAERALQLALTAWIRSEKASVETPASDSRA